MGLYQHIRNIWKKPKKNLGDVWKQRLVLWRREPVTVRIQRPTRVDRARSLGYKAKEGIFVVRQRVKRGGHYKELPSGGRRPKRYGRRKNLSMNYQTIAERRANRKYVNCEVLNSYYVAEDGQHYWYEIIMVDPQHPQIKADKDLKWLGDKQQTRRVFRGLTSSARKSRALDKKGKGVEKARPSRRANNRKQ